MPRNYIKLYTLLVFTFLGLSHSVYAQVQLYKEQFNKDTLAKPRLRDTILKKKNFKRAAGELLLMELVPFSYDNFLMHKDFSKISFSSVGHNLKPSSWGFDQDIFQTNQIGHPYQGSLFYSSFRANGYTFWQAAPAAFAGSYLWETFGEKEPPAINDFINTGFGGVVLGEMSYRLSNKIINNHRRGTKRQVDEVLGFLINPINGLNRILDGKWGKVSPNSLEQDSSKINAEFDLGERRFSINNAKGQYGWYGRARLLYGTPYENYKTPFSNISITVEVGKDDSTTVNIVSAYGSLTGWILQSSTSVKHLAIISANYDYIRNAAFFYGGQSVKMNLYSEFKIDDDIKINTALGAGPIILAAVPDPHIYDGRNYDYGPGVSYNISAGITVINRLEYSVNYRSGITTTLNGNSSHYVLHGASTEASFTIIPGLSIAAEIGYYSLNGYYKNYPDVNNKYPYTRAALRYSVNF